MKTLLSLICLFVFIHKVNSQDFWINEINYENPGTDTSEYVEIAGVAGKDLKNSKIILINGGNSAAYAEIKLSGIIPDEINGFGALSFKYNGIQNGAPDGVAFVDSVNKVIEFVSYEGKMTEWIYNSIGYESAEIMVTENNSTPDLSLQKTGNNVFNQTTWAALPLSPGKLNEGQTNPIVTGLEERGDSNQPLETAEWFDVNGKRVNQNERIPNHLYLVKWNSEGFSKTIKTIYIE